MMRLMTRLVNSKKEANSRQILGIFLIDFSELTNSQNIATGGSLSIDFEFTVWDTQQPGRNPATTDAAVVLLRTGSKLKPLILYDLKTAVHTVPQRIAKGDLIELYVQCYYCPNLYELSDIIGCLTDTGTWRYFKIVRTGPNILRIKWTHLIKHTEGELTS